MKHYPAAIPNASERWEFVQLEVLRFCQDGWRHPQTLPERVPMTQQELDDALTYLAEYELLDADRNYSGDIEIAATTHHGRRALQLGSVDEYLKRKNGMTSITNDNSMHVSASDVAGNFTVVGGQNNTVSVGADIPAEVRQDIASGIDELLETVPATPESETLRGELVELRGKTLQPSTDKETLREKLLHALATATISEVTAIAIPGIATLLSSLMGA